MKNSVWKTNKDYIQSVILENGFWFIDIPRTSSSSIRIELGRHFGPIYGKSNIVEKEFATTQIVPDHLTAKEMQLYLGKHIWDRIFTFTIIRNPWARVYSMFNYRRMKGKLPHHWTFRDYVHALSNAGPGTKYFTFYGHRYGVSEYILDNDGNIIVEYIARYENRAQDIKNISSRINYGNLGKILLQGTDEDTGNYKKLYDDETKEIVEKLYHRDIELFGYEFGDH